MNILEQSSKAQDRTLGSWYVQIASGALKLTISVGSHGCFSAVWHQAKRGSLSTHLRHESEVAKNVGA